MIAASALLTSADASPTLAADAVRAALAKAGRQQAQEVILFLTPEFSRLIPASLAAVSRAAGCLQIFGSIAAGVATDEAWAMDRPAAAVLVLDELPTIAGVADDTKSEDTDDSGAPVFSLCGRSHLPDEWLSTNDDFSDLAGLDGTTDENDHGPGSFRESRFGLLYSDALSCRETAVWQGARLAANGHASLRFPGVDAAIGLSTGVSTSGEGAIVGAAQGHELIHLGGLSALDSLRQALPPSLRQHRPLPVHCLCAVVRGQSDDNPQLIPLLSANADGTVTLAQPVAAGSRLSWSLRLPANAEADMKEMLNELAPRCPHPTFGLFMSCIGRGPFFYAGEDRDWALFRQRFPGLPFVGAYGSGQIFSADHQHRLLQNSVITALFSA